MIGVSIIVPVYNKERFLRQCLDSLLDQTYRAIEIICVNDGSTDGSLEILQDYAERDNRIVVIDQENKGAGNARNAGIRIARGRYLQFLDADDFFEPVMIEKMLKKADAKDADIVIFDGDPLEIATKAMCTLIQGEVAYCDEGFRGCKGSTFCNA